MNLTIGISPCPNDTFIFDAIYNKRIDTKGLSFEFIIEDVERLNQLALSQSPDITKLSYFTFGKVTDHYQMLTSGGALGSNCGPLLVSAQKDCVPKAGMTVAIPGYNTTANFLLTRAYPQLTQKKELLFSSIEDAVVNGETDLGLIIHESRFTYQSKGLYKVRDLGVYWEEETGAPIPLGGIVIKRSLPDEVKKLVNDLISQSVKYAFEHPTTSNEFVYQHAKEMEEDVIRQHIQLYVNDYSIDLGVKGKAGVDLLFKKMLEHGFVDNFTKPLYVDH